MTIIYPLLFSSQEDHGMALGGPVDGVEEVVYKCSKFTICQNFKKIKKKINTCLAESGKPVLKLSQITDNQ